MGYTVQPSSNVFQHFSPPTTSINLSTVLTDFALTPFASIPGLKGNLLAAFMDLYFPNVRNTNAATNHIDSMTLQVQDTGASWQDVLIVAANTMWIQAQTSSWQGVCLRGFTDIASYLDLSTVTNIKLIDCQVNVNNLVLYNTYCGLRLNYE